MAQLQKNFSATNLNFLARLLIFVLSIGASFGIQFPADPTTLGTDIATTLTTGGMYAVIAILAVSVIMPVVNFIRSKPGTRWLEVLSSPNTWIYVANFLLGMLILNGVAIPDGTSEALVGAAFAKDWAALFTVAGANIIDPFIRWLRDKRNKAVTANAR